MKQWVKSALKLLTAAVVSVALLFGMSRITDMVLSRQHQEEARTALDGRLSMEQLEELDTGESESVQRAYRARDAAGGVSGYAIQMQVRGYGGPMTVWVALTADGHRFLGLRVTEQQETENLGSRVTESAFADQFARRAAPSIWTATPASIPPPPPRRTAARPNRGKTAPTGRKRRDTIRAIGPLWRLR